MAVKLHRWTRADLARLPDDGNRYEVLDGELFVTPVAGVEHQDVSATLLSLLREYCERHGVGWVFAPGGFPFGKNQLEPDVMVVPGRPSSRHVEWTSLPRPILVVEILSGSTALRDRFKKRGAYVRRGIPEYWIVDRDERAISVVRPGEPDQLVTDTLTWAPNSRLPHLEIPLRDVFRMR